MRRISIVVVLSIVVLVAGVLAPADVWARRVTAGGSFTINGPGFPAPLTTEIVVTALTANQGQQPTIVTQLPLPGNLFVMSFFVNAETNGAQPGDIDTLLLVTNTTGGSLPIFFTLYNTSGTLINTVSPSQLLPHETRLIRVSDMIP